MTRQKPLILISNDDGFFSKGIKALINSVKDLGEIVVVAPDGPRSGMSCALTSIHPIRVQLLDQEDNYKLYSCTGTPVDCIKLAMNQLLDRKPDLILAGINHGSNSAVSVLYSGTMGAAIEGCLFGVPAIGFSLLNHSSDADFSTSEIYTRLLSQKVLAEGLPEGTCLNVNIPDSKIIKGIKIARQCPGKWTKEIKKSTDGMGSDVYWLSGEFDNTAPNATDTDEAILADGYVSIVPVKIDMTDYMCIDGLRKWEIHLP